jgi:transposase InsO family protein
MNIHKNARLTPQGRALLVHRVHTDGWRVGAAAVAAGISERRAFVWLARHRAGGELALQDRSSAPARCKHRTNPDTLAAIERLRRQRRTGPQIARDLSLPRSTVGAVLRRLGLGRLRALEAKPKIIRYEREKPGELIHIDIKKLGRIDGIGHRITGDRTGQSNQRGTGWEYLHVAIDDACRLAYSEVLANEKADSAVAFSRRALAWFKRCGVSVERIMTDNGSAYKSFAFRDLLAEQDIRHKRTRPYTPRTNGKAERFIQTSLREWAYAQPYKTSAERIETLKPWLTTYNTTRTHSGIKHMTPFAKLNNVLGFDI